MLLQGIMHSCAVYFTMYNRLLSSAVGVQVHLSSNFPQRTPGLPNVIETRSDNSAVPGP